MCQCASLHEKGGQHHDVDSMFEHVQLSCCLLWHEKTCCKIEMWNWVENVVSFCNYFVFVAMSACGDDESSFWSLDAPLHFNLAANSEDWIALAPGQQEDQKTMSTTQLTVENTTTTNGNGVCHTTAFIILSCSVGVHRKLEKGVCKGKDFVEHDDLVGSRSKRWWFGGFPIKEMINCSMITSKSLPVGKTANPKIVKESENAAKEHFPVQNFVRTSWKCWKFALRAKKWLWICVLFIRMRMSWATCLLLFVWLHVKKKKRNRLFGPVGRLGYQLLWIPTACQCTLCTAAHAAKQELWMLGT